MMSWDPYADFESAVLPNGLTVHAAHWPGRPWQAMGFLIHSGAEQDPVGLEGLAHFVEHLVSENAPIEKKDILALFEDRGGWVNLGSTGYPGTKYRFFVPADRETLASAFSLFGNMLLTSRLEKFIERERRVIIGEYRQEFPLEFKYNLLKRGHEMMYQGYWLERFVQPLGNLESISRITENDLQSYYDSHYTPANISIVSVGGMELSSLIEILSQSPFAVDKEGCRTPLPVPIAELSPPLETKYDFDVSKHVTSPVASGSYRSIAKIPGNAKKQVVRVLSGMLSDILNEEIREKRAWAYDFDCSRHYFRHFYELAISCSALATEALGGIDVVVSDCIAMVAEREDLFEQTVRQAIARTRMTDVTGTVVCRECLDDLVDFQQIVSLTDVESYLKQVTMEDVRQMLRHLDQDWRWTLIYHP